MQAPISSDPRSSKSNPSFFSNHPPIQCLGLPSPDSVVVTLDVRIELDRLVSEKYRIE